VPKLAEAIFDISGKATWQVLDHSRGVNGRPSETRVRVIEEARVEDWDTEFDAATRLYVRSDPDGSPVIVGKVRALTPNLSWSGEDESLVATLVGGEWDLRRHGIFGQLCKPAGDADATTPEYMTGLKCVFNYDGKPNRLKDGGGGSSDLHMFHPDPAETGADAPLDWTVQQAVEYVIQSYLAWCSDETVTPVIATIGDISWPSSGGYEDAVLHHVRVHALTVDQALSEILSRNSMGWCLVPNDSTDEAHTLHIFVNGDQSAAAAGDQLDLHLPAVDGSLPGDGANEEKAAAAGHLILDHVPIVTRVNGYSGVKVFEDTFHLLPGWWPEDEEFAMGGASVTNLGEQLGYLKKNMNPDTSADWEKCKWVFRRWVLNETGREANYDEETDPYDFESLFGNTKYTVRPRPFFPHRMELDDQGRPKDVQVLVESPIHAYQSDAEYEWELLTDVAGVYFTGPTPPVFYWRGFVADDVVGIVPDGVWVIGAVESDECYLYQKEGASPDITGTVIDQVLDLEGKLAWDNKNGSALEAAFDASVDKHASAWAKRVDAGRVTIEVVAMDFRPGQWVTSISGRTITLRAQIVGVRWDLERQQTHLALSTMMADLDGEPLRAEPVPEGVMFGPEAPEMFTDEYGKVIRGEVAVPRRFLPDWSRERKAGRDRPQIEWPGHSEADQGRGPLDRGIRRLQEPGS
jgi:hypothetical protein